MFDRTDGKVCLNCMNCVCESPFKGEYPFCILHGKALEPCVYSLMGCENFRAKDNRTYAQKVMERNTRKRMSEEEIATRLSNLKVVE